MAYSHKTFRKCGSHYSELAALEGVEVKIGEKFRPPRKITLPVGFHVNDPTEVLSLTYDFTLENEIIAKAEKEKEKQIQLKQKELEETAAALKTKEQVDDSDLSISTTTPISIFSNVGTDILQPIAVPSTAHKRNDSLGKHTIDLSDFEANGTNPFELVELQTINDFDVLKSVLEPVSNSSSKDKSGLKAVASSEVSTNVQPTSATGSIAPQSSSPKPFNHLSNQTPISSTSQGNNHSKLNSRLSKSVPDLCNDQLVDVSCNENVTQFVPGAAVSMSRSVSPPMSMPSASQPNASISMGYGMPTQPFSYLQGGLPAHRLPDNQPTSSHGLGINSTHITESITPLNLASSSDNNFQVSNPLVMTAASVTSHNKLPPLCKAPPIPPRPTSHKNLKNIDSVNSSFQGLTMTDGVSMNARLPTPPTSTRDLPRGPSSNMTHSSEVSSSISQSLIKRQPAQKGRASSSDNVRHHSTPLPPITPPASSKHSTTNQAPQSVLPDPMPVLNQSEKGLVQYIAAMGFPIPRVARAVQRLGEKDREVVDFLVAVEELCQKGFTGDNCEVALAFNNDDSKKALEFLNLTKTLKELGFEELHIHEALRAADNDRDKALDFLASLSSS